MFLVSKILSNLKYFKALQRYNPHLEKFVAHHDISKLILIRDLKNRAKEFQMESSV